MVCPLRNAESRAYKSAFLPAGETTNLSACLAVGDCGVSKDRSTAGAHLGAPAPAAGVISFAFLLFGAKGFNIFSSFGAVIECGLHPFGFPRPLHQWSLNAL